MTHRGYIGQVFEVRPVLAAMEDRGMPIDDDARLKLDAEFEAAQREMLAKIQAQVPKGIGRVQPKDGYKGVNGRRPPEVQEWISARYTSTFDYGPEGFPIEQIYGVTFKDSGDDGESYHYEQRPFSVPIVDADSGEPTLTQMTRWCRVYDFNPNSRNQVISYMKAKGHPIPKDKHREDAEGNNPDTTNEKELRRLANKTGDLFYIDVIEYRGLTKLRGTYVEGFKPGADGFVHPTFTFDTGIGQLTSRNPNSQNFPKLKPTVALATALRAIVCAKSRKIITEWDWKSCHVITLGFLAEDLQYMRLGRLDIHSFVAGHFLNLWDGAAIVSLPDEALIQKFKWLKSDPVRKRVRDDQAKHGILGIGNGLKAKGLFDRYMESFPPKPCECGTGKVQGLRGLKNCPECYGTRFIPGSRIAERVLDVCQKLFPKVFEFQRREVRVAHDQQYLKSAFGHIRRFYEVFRWDHRKSDWGHGDQHEEAVAYRLANFAHAQMRLTMKELANRGLAEKYGMYNQIHDALQFHFDESLLEEHVAEVFPVMTAPSPIMVHPTICPQGLSFGVEASWGYRWSQMQEISLPKSISQSIIPAAIEEATHATT